MKINFRSKYLDYGYIINNDFNIYSFHFFKNNELLYTKKMVYNLYTHNYNRISKSVLNLFYENNYKISYVCVIILLTDIYVNKNQQLIYINVYNKNNSLYTFIIGSYYKFCSHEYIKFNREHTYYIYPLPRQIGNFYYYNHYITNQEINNVCNQLEICGKSVRLLHVL